MTDGEDERIARARVDDAIDRLVRFVGSEGERSANALRARMYVGRELDRLVRVTREAAPPSAERAGD